jgi:hypothetical protein
MKAPQILLIFVAIFSAVATDAASCTCVGECQANVSRCTASCQRKCSFTELHTGYKLTNEIQKTATISRVMFMQIAVTVNLLVYVSLAYANSYCSAC